MPALLTARHLTQTLLLTVLFLMVAVTTALLACGPVAQPVPAETDTRLTAQSAGENPESNRDTPEPQAMATPTPKPSMTPTKEPTATAQAATPTPTQELITATPAPTPEDECLNEIIRELEGKIYIDCIAPFTIPPTPKYSIVGHRINKFLLAAEQAARAATDFEPTEAETSKVFVKIETSSDTDTIAIVKWLENSRVRRYNDRTKNDIGSIHSSDGHPYNYIYANIPVYLLIPLIHQAGITKIEDGCLDAYFCHTQYPRNYVE